MKTNRLFILSIFTFVVFSCKKNEVNSNSVAPIIKSLSSANAHKNENITITGINFETDVSKIIVTINNKSCNVISATTTSITFTIPPKCGSGDVVVKINGIESNRLGFIYDWTTTLYSITNGTVGYLDGSITLAKWEEVAGLCVDNLDNIYTCSFGQPRIRKISSDLLNAYTLAGDGTVGNINAQGVNAKLGNMDNITVDANRNIYVGDQTSSNIKKIDPLGNVTIFIPNPVAYPEALKIGKLGNLYVKGAGSIAKYNSVGVLQWVIKSHGNGNIDGDTSVFQIKSHLFGNPAIDDNEQSLYFAVHSSSSTNASQIKKLNMQTMTISTMAGTTMAGSDDGVAVNASFNLITSMVLDNTGGLFIADGFNHKIRYLKDGNVSTIVGNGNGDIDGDASVAKLGYPDGLDINSKGEIIIGCVNNNKVKKIIID